MQCKLAVQVYKQQLNALITVVGSFESIHSPDFPIHILVSNGVCVMIFFKPTEHKAIISMTTGFLLFTHSFVSYQQTCIYGYVMYKPW